MEQGDPGWLRGHQASATESTESQSCGGWKEPLELPQPSPPQHIHTADTHKASRWVWISAEEPSPPPPPLYARALCQGSATHTVMFFLMSRWNFLGTMEHSPDVNPSDINQH